MPTFARQRWADRRGRASSRPDGVPGLGTAELAAHAARALVHVDDAVRTSEQELGFAIAAFGERAMTRFSAAVESASAELREAFRLHQLVDDGPADDASVRSLLTDVTQRCATASELLDDQADEFDRAQPARAGAAQLAAEIEAHIAQQSARISMSRDVLDRLAVRYTPGAVESVASNPDLAATLLDFAADAVSSAHYSIDDSHTGQAAVLLQAAEAAADQATDLLTGVLHREAELTQAASAVPAALREIDAEIAEATARVMGRPDQERAAHLGRARAVHDDVRADLAAGPFDALVALRELQQADVALDRALAGVRTPEARRQRAVAVLDEAMLVARSTVTAAEDFIAARRGAVGVTARTRLAEAWRHFQQAITASQQDPELALTEAQEADALSERARQLAAQDVATCDESLLSAGDAGIRGAILGGILIDGPAGGVGPGSFGGTGTRARHAVESPTHLGGPCPNAASSAELRS